MDKQLVNDLRTVINAAKKRDATIFKNQTLEYKHYMNPEIIKRMESMGTPISPVEPKKPQKSAPPQKPNPPQKPPEPTKKELPTKKTVGGVDWSYPEIYPAIPIISVILIFIGLFSLLQGAWGWIVVGIGAASLIIPYIKKIIEEFVVTSRDLKAAISEVTKLNEQKQAEYEEKMRQYEEAMAKHNASMKKYEEAYAEWKTTGDAKFQEAMKVYEAAMEEYKKEKAKYNEECKHYSEVYKEYKDEKSIAIQKMNAFNDDVRNKAEKEFEDTLNSLETYVPPKYIDIAKELLQYVLDARADTLKEAIELYLKEKQELERDLQRAAEASRAAEIAEQQLRIQKGMQQCSQCRQRSSCTRTAYNDGRCDYFSTYDRRF